VVTVGLTGGIGSGKSQVAQMLAERGAVVIDADQLAREAVAPGTPGLAAVVAEFGPEVLRPDGSLDRPRLGSIVFGDEQRLRALEDIVHPYVGKRSAELIARAPEHAVVVYDVPLLVENDLQDAYDLVVVVDADPETALARLVQRRGMTEGGARARMLAQASRASRLAVADRVVDNDGDLDALAAQVDRLLADLLAIPPQGDSDGVELDERPERRQRRQ
jgi:dephospho-CoA kinase